MVAVSESRDVEDTTQMVGVSELRDVEDTTQMVAVSESHDVEDTTQQGVKWQNRKGGWLSVTTSERVFRIVGGASVKQFMPKSRSRNSKYIVRCCRRGTARSIQ